MSSLIFGTMPPSSGVMHSSNGGDMDVAHEREAAGWCMGMTRRTRHGRQTRSRTKADAAFAACGRARPGSVGYRRKSWRSAFGQKV